MEKTIVLTLYELSGIFTKLYQKLGHEVIQVDKQIDGSDVRLMRKIKGNVVGIISHPPCTHFAGSGARWWKDKTNKQLVDALSMVDAVYRMVYIYEPEFWFIENPVGRLCHYIGKPNFYFHPHEFAGWLDNPETEAFTKKTCLWGEFNIPQKCSVEPKFITLDSGKRMSQQHYDSFRLQPKDRMNARSKTAIGFARAFVSANPGTVCDSTLLSQSLPLRSREKLIHVTQLHSARHSVASLHSAQTLLTESFG